ncbi:hypothetical protein EYR41_005888 [Orbilia oligospora]|uniref:BTB domain-containing protein n=1 Tax=Orbilia oligospora TaxID=2813651 RepID=A0A8H2DZH6_ORBOL|nr:hypothetical protein EYR41_005888 [Orbilia oligospora]
MVRGHTENLVHSCEILEIDVNARNEIERLPRHCASGILVVFVGENKRKYRVHLDAFRGASPFFERETLQKSKDSHIQNITLTEKVDDPEAFEMFIQFAYIKELYRPQQESLGSTLHSRQSLCSRRKIGMHRPQGIGCQTCHEILPWELRYRIPIQRSHR